MINIYVPNLSYSCYVVRDKDTIRAYHIMPTTDSYIDYTDYFINSHYIEKNGIEHFNVYSSIPTCLSSDILTSDFYYRNDLPDILSIFNTFAIYCVLIPLLLFKKLYKRKSL